MTTLTDREVDTGALVARARKGDVGAFEALYRANASRVFGICMRMASSRDEAEGWSQQIWVRVWERLGTFRAESRFSTWLHRLAVNLILDRKRSEARRVERRAKVESMWTERKSFDHREDMLDLQKAVDELPDRARTVFLLYDVEGYKHREIAERLGVAEGTVKAHLHRARRMLREALSR